MSDVPSEPVESPLAEGRVRINKTKVSTRQTDAGTFLFHAPSARVVTLDPSGERIWTKIESGTDDISRLVAEHQQETGVSAEAAAFRVISFLDILRAEDFVRFSLAGGNEDAPLLDVSLNSPTPLEFAAPDEDSLDMIGRVAEAIGRKEITTIRAERPTLTLAELKTLAARDIGTELDDIHQVKIVDLEQTELNDAVFRQVAARRLTDDSMRDRRYFELGTPSSDVSLAHLMELQSANASDSGKRLVSRIIVIIIIIFRGPIIIIIIGGGTGPTFGKSRNACKTVCV